MRIKGILKNKMDRITLFKFKGHANSLPTCFLILYRCPHLLITNETGNSIANRLRSLSETIHDCTNVLCQSQMYS